MAFAALGHAAGDPARRAGHELFRTFVRRAIEPGEIEPKVEQATRPSKGIGPLMIAVGVAQALRSAGRLVGEALVDGWIDAIERDFCRADLGAVLELVAPTAPCSTTSTAGC